MSRPLTNTPLPCIDCRSPLSEAEPEPGIDTVRCQCGLRYSTELLAQANWETWAYVVNRRLFCFQCGDPTAPLIYADDAGQPTACPTHGPAPTR